MKTIFEKLTKTVISKFSDVVSIVTAEATKLASAVRRISEEVEAEHEQQEPSDRAVKVEKQGTHSAEATGGGSLKKRKHPDRGNTPSNKSATQSPAKKKNPPSKTELNPPRQSSGDGSNHHKTIDARSDIEDYHDALESFGTTDAIRESSAEDDEPDDETTMEAKEQEQLDDGDGDGDGEFEPDKNEVDDEATMEAEEMLGRDMTYEEELEMLNQENEMPVEKLRAIYTGIIDVISFGSKSSKSRGSSGGEGGSNSNSSGGGGSGSGGVGGRSSGSNSNHLFPYGNPSITEIEYEKLEALMEQFCRVPLLAEFIRPVVLLQPELMSAYTKIVERPIDLGKVCRRIRRRQYTNLRDVRLDVWRIFANSFKYHSHPSNKDAIPAIASIALHLRDFFNDLWQEHVLPSDFPPPAPSGTGRSKPHDPHALLRAAMEQRIECRKKRLVFSGSSVMDGKYLERAAEALNDIIENGGLVDALDTKPIWGEGIVMDDDDEGVLEIVLKNFRKLEMFLREIVANNEELTVHALESSIRNCYTQGNGLENMNAILRIRIASRMNRYLGQLVVPFHEAIYRGVSQSSIWGCMVCALWARESSKKPFWPALVLGIIATEDRQKDWHRLLNERNEARLPEKLKSQLLIGKRKAEQAVKRQTLGQIEPQSFLLVEFLGSHEFMWVQKADMIHDFNATEDPNKEDTAENRSKKVSCKRIVESKTYANAIEKALDAIEERELQLQDIWETVEDDSEDEHDEKIYSYSVLSQSDDEADDETDDGDDFQAFESEPDDETTMEAEERLGRDMTYEEEIELLNRENEMSVEELRALYAGRNNTIENDDTAVSVATAAAAAATTTDGKTVEESTEERVTKDDDDDDGEFEPDKNEVDDETTIEVEELLGQDMTYKEELEMLNRENDVSVDELRAMYDGTKDLISIDSESPDKEMILGDMVEADEFWNQKCFSNKSDDERVSAVVYMSDPSFSLHPDDVNALSSLILHLWNKNQSFFLTCYCDNDGKIISISDDAHGTLCTSEIGEWETCVVFHSRTIHWNGILNFYEIAAIEMRFCGYHNVWINEATTHPSIQFPRLEKVILTMPFESFEAIFSWITDKKLPSFEKLHFSYGYLDGEDYSNDYDYSGDILTLLRTLDFRVAKKIKLLFFHPMYPFEANHLETLFFEILPNFSNLHSLSLEGIGTRSLRRILDRNTRSEAVNKFPLKSLHQLSLKLGSKSVKSKHQKMLIRFLRSFNTVCDFGESFKYKDPDLHYAMITNHMGRKLLENDGHGDNDGDGSGSNSSSGSSKSSSSNRSTTSAISMTHLPHSVWPIVLKRAQTLPRCLWRKHNYKSMQVTGIYYLLREGPILFDSLAVRTDSPVSAMGRERTRRTVRSHRETATIETRTKNPSNGETF